jgi:hypothetical protein
MLFLQDDIEDSLTRRRKYLPPEICERQWRGRGFFVFSCMTQPLACRAIRLRLDDDQLGLLGIFSDLPRH